MFSLLPIARPPARAWRSPLVGVATSATLALALGGCGNRGDLYLAPDAALERDALRIDAEARGATDGGAASGETPPDGSGADSPLPAPDLETDVEPVTPADTTGADPLADEGARGDRAEDDDKERDEEDGA